MSQTICAFLSLFCMFGYVSMGQCAFSDELSLIQERARALPQQQKWPDISKIVDQVKEAADAAKGAAEGLNETVHDKLDQAASATATAIKTVIETLRQLLEKILTQSDDFENKVQNAVDEFLNKVKTNPELHTLESAANQTLDAFDGFLQPVATALNASIGTVRDMLSASGYKDLSEQVGKRLTQAMGAIEDAHLTAMNLKKKVGELDAKVNKSAGNISSEVDKDLRWINKKLHELVGEVNTTFVDKTQEGYEMLTSQLRSSVEDILPEKQLKEVVESLDSMGPVVDNITYSMAAPMQSLDTGFDEAIAEVRENVPGSARGTAVFSFLALLVALGANWIML